MLFAAGAGLLALVVAAPVLIRLGNSLILPLIVLVVALVAIRLVWFHTRRW
jgi:hypothetical protein